MEKMVDLMYFGYEWETDARKLEKDFIREVEEAFPDITLNDAYDEIKGYRRSVFYSTEKEDDYLLWALCHGWFYCSFSLQTMEKGKLDKLLEKGRDVYPECYKQ